MYMFVYLFIYFGDAYCVLHPIEKSMKFGQQYGPEHGAKMTNKKLLFQITVQLRRTWCWS